MIVDEGLGSRKTYYSLLHNTKCCVISFASTCGSRDEKEAFRGTEYIHSADKCVCIMITYHPVY